MGRRVSDFFRSTQQFLGAILIISLSWCQLWGLDPDKPVAQYLEDKWEFSDGIPSNTVKAITQTPDGYLWVATLSGLVRFDGMKFSPPPFGEETDREPQEIPIPNILLLDRDGTLWIGGSGFLWEYRCQTHRFKIYTTADGITLDPIRCIKVDMKGYLWIGFQSSYVNRFFNGKFTAFNASHGLEGKKINTIIENQNGDLLFGTRENGAFVFKDGTFRKYPIPGLDNAVIIFLYEDRKGELWIGTNKGLFRVNQKGTRRFTKSDGLSNNWISYIMEDSDRNFWVGTTKGLNRLRKKQDGSIRFEPLLKNSFINCLFEDSEKSLWVGTNESGIIRLKDRKFFSYTPLEPYPGEIFQSLFRDRHGYTWLGTANGKLYRCRGSHFIESVEPPAFANIGIVSIAEDNHGNLWLGTNGRGVFQKKNGTFTRYTSRDGLADNTVTSMYRDSKGNLWCSTLDGVSVFRFSGSGFPVIETLHSRNGLSGKRAHNVYEDKNRNIWIAADRGITVLRDGKTGNKNITYYLQEVSVICIYEDVGRVFWAAADGAGLQRLQLSNGVTVTAYTTDQGMTTNYLYRIFEDLRGYFWLMSSSGILRVSKNKLNRFADGDRENINCVSFGKSDGMKSIGFYNHTSRHSALKTKEGEFWFITKKGISIVNPARIQIDKTPPPVVIEKVLFNRESVPLHTSPVTQAEDFRFRFTAPTFLYPGKVKFQYRLDGYNEKWVLLPPGGERTARYNNLGPGNYTFRVIAGNAEGVWNRTGDSFTFTLKPFFYQTFLFKAALLLLLLALAAAVYYILKKRPFKKKREIKYKDSPLDPRAAEECIKKLRYLVDIKKVYKDPDISLHSLAEKLSVSHHLLSQVLNERLNRKFFDFINFHRVEEAKRILQGPRGEQQKIATVAYEVGFNTVVAFYNSFKKFTNMTPTQYRKEIEKK